MYEMRDFAEPEDSEIEPSSSAVSFPDHYLIPYILMCKRSKRITCGCSIFLISLAIYFFFATNYMMFFNYPITESRKIACVFGGVFCLVAAASCLELRFKIIQECRGTREDNVLFEIARRDIELSGSFSAQFDMQDMSFRHGTPNEGPSQTETPEDSISRARTIDDPCFPEISTVRYNGASQLPRHSISDGLDPETPLLPQRRPFELSRPSWMKSGMHSKILQTDGTVSDNNKYNLNYSKFDNSCEVSDTEPLLAKSTFKNGYDATDIGPLLAESTFKNGCETEPQLAGLMFENGHEASETEPLLPDSTFQNGSDTRKIKVLLAKNS